MALELLCCAISFYYNDFKSDFLICSSQVYWLEKCSENGAESFEVYNSFIHLPSNQL